MLRFLVRPKWLAFTLVVVGATLVMVRLGMWQLDRRAERREFNAMVVARSIADPVPFDPLLFGRSVDLDAAEWRVIRVEGDYGLDSETIPAAGSFHLLSSLTTDDGSTVLVNRGSIAVTADLPPVPSGRIELVGRIRQVPRALSDRGTDTYLEAISSTPAEAAGVTPIPAPELGVGPHLSYAIQWFVFAGAVVVGWLLALRHAIRSRRTGLAGLKWQHKAVPWRD